MVQGKMLSKFSERRSHSPGELRHPFYRQLRTQQSLDMVARIVASIRCDGAPQKPRTLADGCHRRRRAGYGDRLLGNDARDPDLRSNPAGRVVGGIQQAVLIRGTAASWKRPARSQG